MTDTAPAVLWRCWLIDGLGHLRPVFDDAGSSSVGIRAEASCYRNPEHAAPASDCHCGLYGAGSLASLVEWLDAMRVGLRFAWTARADRDAGGLAWAPAVRARMRTADFSTVSAIGTVIPSGRILPHRPVGAATFDPHDSWRVASYKRGDRLYIHPSAAELFKGRAVVGTATGSAWHEEILQAEQEGA